MARYTTTIDSTMAPAAALAYMASFDNAREWDPSVVEASRLDSGELAVGSAFAVVSTFAGRRVPLRYEITELDAGHVVLRAPGGGFTSIDTITVVPAGAGSRVTYDARLVFSGAGRVADPLMQLVFNRVGRRAEASLRVHLNRPG
ncbi:MAG: SRPBCC family protein [Candidatus Dormibacteria bacterium]